ncbi:hypothetical protein [Pelobacter seleniigenes]|uniref:hypothetical protein n=1 Tax=Pelobacter seleniigenes TaxID=407188 RepID=UPI0012B94F44|nr:hypothetical protein [Pelobacter seleniigenes]
MKNVKSIPVSGPVVNEYQGFPLLFPGERRNLVDKITTQYPHIYMLIEYLSKLSPNNTISQRIQAGKTQAGQSSARLTFKCCKTALLQMSLTKARTSFVKLISS